MHRRSSKWLRRARHLYAVLIRKSCEEDAFGWMIQEAAKSAKERGLYAEATAERDIRYSLVRKFYKLNPNYNKFDHLSWFKYRKDYNWQIPGFAGKNHRKVAA
jgi:hypothetical protein